MKTYSFVLLLLLICLSCGNDDDTEQLQACENVICTAEFVTLSIAINDQNNNRVNLDLYNVVVVETNEDVTIDEETTIDDRYPLVNDATFQLNSSETITIRFTGFIDDEIVISKNFVVGSDCCHVRLISGETEFTINQ